MKTGPAARCAVISTPTVADMHAVLRQLRHLRPLAAPSGGAVFLALWIIAEAGRSDLGPTVAMVALLATAIGLSSWMPLTALGLVVAVPALQCLGLVEPPSSTTWPTYLAIAIMAGVVGAGGRALPRYLALPAIGVASALAAFAMTVPTLRRPDVWGSWTASGQSPRQDLVVIALALIGVAGIAWAIGVGIGSAWRVAAARTGLAHAEQQLEETSFELRVAEDRARIARDVHDSLAHSLAIVVSQAQGASAVAVSDPTAQQALDDIAEVGRDALADVRRLVERIREDDVATPRATLADVPALVAQMREVGMGATLVELGAPDGLAPSQELAVYRIVQESLTNALKHGGRTSTVRVVLEWRGPGLALFVTSTGSTPLVPGASAGVGIRGMEERARLAGGWVRAAAGEPESAASGREERIPFVVTAWVPGHAAGESTAPRPSDLAPSDAVVTGARAGTGATPTSEVDA
jgi:signal transduction histidine kinase